MNYVATQDTLRVAMVGDMMTDDLVMGNNKVTSLANPTASQDAAMKNNEDSLAQATVTLVESKTLLSGSTTQPAANINCNNNHITNLADQEDLQDAPTKVYMNSRKPVIAVWAEEKGLLASGEY